MSFNRNSDLQFEWWELVARILGTLLLSILIPLGINLVLSQQISPLNQFFLATLIFFGTSLVGMAYDMNKMRQRRENENQLRFIEDEFRRHLHNIEEAYRALLRNSRTKSDLDLYSAYYRRRVEEFEHDIRRAAEQGALQADEKHHSTTDLLLQCLQGGEDDVLRLVAFFDNINFMYSTYQQTYYRWIIDKVEKDEIKDVRRLMVYKQGQRDNPAAEKLIKFHQRQPGYSCKLIQIGDFKRFCDDHRTNQEYNDFGIYGPWYVYVADVSDPDGDVKGTYYRREETINEYIELFDNCWEHGHSPSEPPDTKEPMPLEELFGEEPADILEDSEIGNQPDEVSIRSDEPTT